MKMEKNTRYNNKPDEVIIYPERVEKKESGKKSFLVQLGSNLKKQETNICAYVCMFKKPSRALPRLLVVLFLCIQILFHICIQVATRCRALSTANNSCFHSWPLNFSNISFQNVVVWGRICSLPKIFHIGLEKGKSTSHTVWMLQRCFLPDYCICRFCVLAAQYVT